MKMIVTGSSDTEDAAIEWLKSKGAVVDTCLGITLITLPNDADVAKGAYPWQFTIDFPADEDDTSYVEVELDVDAYETVLRSHP